MGRVEAEARPSIAWLRLLALLFGVAPAPAQAGAWLAPEGGQEIWTNAIGWRDGLNYYESATYWEAPLNDRVSIVAAHWLEQGYGASDGWRGEATLGVKRSALRTERAVVAVQGGAFWQSDPDGTCREGGAEARLLAGRSVGERGFANAELAGRMLDGGCASIRIDLTAGYRATDDWLALGQVFVEHDEREAATKAQFTLVHFGEDGRGLQVGVRARLGEEDPEPALVVALWGRPGDD